MPPCESCGKFYSHQSSLARHVHLKHFGTSASGDIAPKTSHSCPQCHKTFSRADTLRRHQRGHTGDNGQKCSICARSMRKDSLREHERRCILRVLKRPERFTINDALEVEQEPIVKSKWQITASSLASALRKESTAPLDLPIQVIPQRRAVSKRAMIPLLRKQLLNDLYVSNGVGIRDLSQRLEQLGLTLADLDTKRRRILHLACLFFDHDLSIVELMLKNGVDIDERDSFGFTAVQFVCELSKEQHLKLLIDRGANLGLRVDQFKCESHKDLVLYDASALTIAAHVGFSDGVRLLLKAGTSAAIDRAISATLRPFLLVPESTANEQDIEHHFSNSFHTFLKCAIEVGMLNVVEAMVRAIETRMHVDRLRDDLQRTLFFTALEARSTEIADLFLEAGADINATFDDSYPALGLAVERNDLLVVRYLLERGARTGDIEFCTSSEEIFDMLIDAGARATQFHPAFAARFPRILRKLLALDFDATADHGTMLQVAMLSGPVEAVEILFQARTTFAPTAQAVLRSWEDALSSTFLPESERTAKIDLLKQYYFRVKTGTEQNASTSARIVRLRTM